MTPKLTREEVHYNCQPPHMRERVLALLADRDRLRDLLETLLRALHTQGGYGINTPVDRAVIAGDAAIAESRRT